MIPVLHCVLDEKFTFTSKAAMFELVKILFSTLISVTAGKMFNITVVLYGPTLYGCVTQVSPTHGRTGKHSGHYVAGLVMCVSMTKTPWRPI